MSGRGWSLLSKRWLVSEGERWMEESRCWLKGGGEVVLDVDGRFVHPGAAPCQGMSLLMWKDLLPRKI